MIFEQIKNFLSTQLNIDESKITMDATFVEDLNIDSLDLVELILALEEEYNIEVDEEDAEKLSTIGDVVNYVNSQM